MAVQYDANGIALTDEVKESSKTFEGSIDGAVGTLKRQLIKRKEKMTGR